MRHCPFCGREVRWAGYTTCGSSECKQFSYDVNRERTPRRRKRTSGFLSVKKVARTVEALEPGITREFSNFNRISNPDGV